MDIEAIARQLPAIIVIVPVVAGVLCTVVGWWRRSLCQPLGVGALAATFAASLWLLIEVALAEGNRISYWLSGWEPVADEAGHSLAFGIELNVDFLNAPILVVVSAIALLATVYSRVSIRREFGEKEPHFYCMALFFVTGMLGILLTGDAFNLYVLIEIASISTYALIAMGKGPAPLAAFHYMLMGSIGASFYLIGIGYLYALTGTLNMNELGAILATAPIDPVMVTAFVFVLVGLAMKMALFPLHWWVPNAYAKAADPSSVLLAPLFTKVSVYAMLRMLLDVFPSRTIFDHMPIDTVLVGLGVIGIVYGSVMAIRQRELKRMLAYILVAEMGYFAGGIGLHNEQGLIGAMFHVPADALMMVTLFMVAGAAAQELRSYEKIGLRGLFRRMPWTATALVIAALSVIGVPPTCGFFSKLYLIQGAFAAGRYDFAAALLFASVMAAAMFLRLFEIARQGLPQEELSPPPKDPPLSMCAPMMIGALSLIILGLAAAPLADVFAGKLG